MEVWGNVVVPFWKPHSSNLWEGRPGPWVKWLSGQDDKERGRKHGVLFVGVLC